MSSLVSEVLAKVDRLEPFPKVAVRVLELAMSDAPTIELARVIDKDPGLTTKVLRLCNSAAYGARHEIASIAEACARIGSDGVASLAVTSGCASFYMGYGHSTRRSNASLWRECLHVAFFARHLDSEAPETSYTLGLLQNMAHVVLDRFMEDRQDAILALVDEGTDVIAAEQAVLGIDHATCGAYMAQRWEFPKSIRIGIRCHHNPRFAPEHLRRTCRILRVAEGLTVRTLAPDGMSMLAPIDPHFVERSGLREEDVERLAARVTESVDEVMESMA